MSVGVPHAARVPSWAARPTHRHPIGSASRQTAHPSRVCSPGTTGSSLGKCGQPLAGEPPSFLSGKQSRIKTIIHQSGFSQLYRKHCSDKLEVFTTTRHQFAHRKIIGLKTPTGAAARIFIPERDQAFFPAFWEDRSFPPHSMCVITESLVKERSLSDCAINKHGPFRIVTGKNIGLHRPYQNLQAWLGAASQQGLTSNNNDIGGIRVRRCRPDNMLKLGSIHGVRIRAEIGCVPLG